MSLLNTIREEREEIVGEVTRDGIDPDSRSFLWQNLSSGLLFQSVLIIFISFLSLSLF